MTELVDIDASWLYFLGFLEQELGGKHSLESILLLVGVREMGWNIRKFKKEEKVDLMHVGLCTLLEPLGYYTKTKIDSDGWPHWDITKALPEVQLRAQIHLIKERLLLYFGQVYERSFFYIANQN